MQVNPFESEYEMDSAAAPLGFFHEVDAVKRQLLQYDDNIERIEGLQRRSLAESRPAELESLERQMDAIRAECRGLSGVLRNSIKDLESRSLKDATRYAQSSNLKQQFMTMIQKFQQSEAAFRKRYTEAATREYRIVEPEATDAEIDEFLANGGGAQVFSQALQQSNRLGDARAALSEVVIRQRELQKIETTLAELAQLFHDMELMVAEQDQLVEGIETNVFQAQQDIERGVDNQEVAIRKAKAWRKKKWCCLAIVVVIVVALALSLGIYYGSKH